MYYKLFNHFLIVESLWHNFSKFKIGYLSYYVYDIAK